MVDIVDLFMVEFGAALLKTLFVHILILPLYA